MKSSDILYQRKWSKFVASNVDLAETRIETDGIVKVCNACLPLRFVSSAADEDYGDDDASNNLICNTFIKYVLYIFFVNSAITLIWTIWMSTLKVCKTCHPLRFVSWAPESGHSSILPKKKLLSMNNRAQ